MKKTVIVSFVFLITLLTLSCKKNDSSDSIFGKWQVDGFVEHSDSVAQSSPGDIFIEFTNSKTINVELEINNCGGGFSIESSKINISELTCTMACCDSDFSKRMLLLLPKVENYYFVNGQLTLSGADNLSIRLKK